MLIKNQKAFYHLIKPEDDSDLGEAILVVANDRKQARNLAKKEFLEYYNKYPVFDYPIDDYGNFYSFYNLVDIIYQKNYSTIIRKQKAFYHLIEPKEKEQYGKMILTIGTDINDCLNIAKESYPDRFEQNPVVSVPVYEIGDYVLFYNLIDIIIRY